MAEIIVKYDTKSKVMEVTKDGVKVDDVARCEFYKSEDGHMCMIQSFMKNKEDDCTETYGIYASKDKRDEVASDVKKYLENQYKKQ